MAWEGLWRLWVPFLGTVLGAAAVLGMPMGSEKWRQGLNGFAAGMMLGAAEVNLLLPAMAADGAWAFLGVMAGIGLLFFVEQQWGQEGSAGTVLLAVVLHNIPEGMAVGICGEGKRGTVLGIALQNIPDGAVAAMPLAGMGVKKGKAFLLGALTGAVEPLAALGAMALGRLAGQMEPGLMGFAAGAMVYVVIRELIPRMGRGWGIFWWVAGMLIVLV